VKNLLSPDKQKNRSVLNIAYTGIFVLISFVAVFWAYGAINFNGDNYFMLANAKVIFESGFPVTDPLSMHSSFAYMTPQWLYACLIYWAQQTFGNIGIFFVALIAETMLAIVVGIVSKKLCSDETVWMFWFFLLFIPFYVAGYSIVRPMVFTVLFCMIEYLLIDQMRSKWKFFLLFLISVLQINMHNSLWVSLILIWLCFFGEHVVESIKQKKMIGLPEDLIAIICLATGSLINPYGIDYVLYIFPSMEALKPFMGIINELLPSKDPLKIIYTACVVIVTVIGLIKKKKIPYRFLFMTLGFSAMFFYASRNWIFMLTFGSLSGLMMTDRLIGIRGTKCPQISVLKKTIPLSFVLMLIVAIEFPQISDRHAQNEQIQNEYDIFYNSMDKITKDSKILCSFNLGSYLEYNGYKPYIDPRAEIFGIANNGQYDVASEFVYLTTDCPIEYFKEVVCRYDFDYLICSSERLQKFAEESGLFEKYKEKDITVIYKRKR